jgi:hypothetical protein
MRHAMTEERPEGGVHQPTRMGDALPGERQARPQRAVEAVAHIVLAVRCYRHVGRQNESVVAGGLHPIDHRRDALFVAGQIGLEPARLPVRSHAFKPRQRRRAHDEGDSRLRRLARQRHVAVIGDQRAHPHRRDAERVAIALAQETCRLVAVGDIDQHARHEIELRIGGTVGRERTSVLGGA